VGADTLRADDLFFETPAGRVWSTVEDMAWFARGVIDSTYISQELAATTILLSTGEDAGGRMGMGWYVSAEGTEDVALYHAGSNGRPRAFLAVRALRGRAVALAGRSLSADGPQDFGALTIELMAVVDELASP
jgi:hypothetical protein